MGPPLPAAPVWLRCWGHKHGHLFRGLGQVVGGLCHDHLIAGLAGALAPIPMESIYHRTLLSGHVLVGGLAIARRKPVFLPAAVDIEAVNKGLVAELDVHGSFFVKGHIKVLARDISGLPSFTGPEQNTVEIHRSRFVPLQIVKNLFDVRNGTLGLIYLKGVFVP